MTPQQPTVALIHATPAAMSPARAAFADRFPRARLWNLLDDLLITEASEAGAITPALRRRMESLIAHAVDGGADAVLLTCSLYGAVAHAAAPSGTVPILASDDALFAAVTDHRPGTVLVLGSIPSAVEDTVTRLTEHLGSARVTVDGSLVEGAADAAAAGDQPQLEELLTAAAREGAQRADVIVVGQFSLAPAVPAAAKAVSVPVLSPPHLAADALQARLDSEVPG